MTITFPRDMPARGAVEVEFDLTRQETVAAEQGGRLVSVELGLPRWRMRVRTAAMSMQRLGEWQAFFASLRGAGRTFLAYDPARRYPVAYPGGMEVLTTETGDPLVTETGEALGFAVDLTASSWSVSSERDEITLAGLQPGMQITAGDMLDLSWSSGTKRSLHRCLETVTVSGGGGATVQIEPPVPSYVSTATASLSQPRCVMRLVPGSVSVSTSMHRSGVASFEAMQHLEA